MTKGKQCGNALVERTDSDRMTKGKQCRNAPVERTDSDRMTKGMRRHQSIQKGKMPEVVPAEDFFQKNKTFQSIWNMKFFKFSKFFTIILLLAISLPASWAQGNRDFMRETGKINVVVGVILLIFLGIVLYLVRLERKLTRLEHQLNDDKNEWTN